MTGADVNVHKIGRICLRVGDLQRSSNFYRCVLGFETMAPTDDAPGVCECVLHDGSAAELVRLVLTEGLPPGAYPTGFDHFSLEAPSPADIEAVYERAQAHAAQATHPRIYDGRWQLFVFDPDGYKIEVYAARLPGNEGGPA